MVVDDSTACASVSGIEIKGAYWLGPSKYTPLIPMPETEAHAVKSSTTLDSDSLRKIPREKFHTKINTLRPRENVRQLGVVTLNLVQHTAGGNITLAARRGVLGFV
jgi:hypothetical protein